MWSVARAGGWRRSSSTLIMVLSTVAPLVCLLNVVARWCVSLNPYSGEGTPPMYGDYEAQRHWMEITYNLPVREWYHNTSSNDLKYWGLDYPPLTAYHSLLVGTVANKMNASWVQLFTSQGIESVEHKLFMRYTVLLADVLVYFPAVFTYFATQSLSSHEKLGASLAMLLYPGLMLIDHGHFQYNCVSLGLFVWAVAGLCSGHDLLGSIAFVLALNYKQMELYHAIPFFLYLLGSSFNGKQNWLWKLIKLGFTVVATFCLCWLPFLEDKASLLQVLRRLFPFARGLYEDKVANVWCSLSVLVKLKSLYSQDQLIYICLGSTAVVLLPSAVHLLMKPTRCAFRVALVIASLVFFLFSFQVHEKSILIPSISVCLLLPYRPFPCMWFLLVSVFSMVPLLVKDGLLLPSVASCLFFYITVHILYSANRHLKAVSPSMGSLPKSRILWTLFTLSMIGCCVLTVMSLKGKPPSHLPDLFPVLVSTYSCGHFLLFLIYFHWLQCTWTDTPKQEPKVPSKQQKAVHHGHHAKHNRKKRQLVRQQ